MFQGLILVLLSISTLFYMHFILFIAVLLLLLLCIVNYLHIYLCVLLNCMVYFNKYNHKIFCIHYSCDMCGHIAFVSAMSMACSFLSSQWILTKLS